MAVTRSRDLLRLVAATRLGRATGSDTEAVLRRIRRQALED